MQFPFPPGKRLCRHGEIFMDAKRGFTFTVSALLVALALISMAFFASQWRKSQQLSFGEILPSESTYLMDRISGLFRTAAGVNVETEKTGALSARVKMSLAFPLKKEGAGVLDAARLSHSLSSSLRGTGVEATVHSTAGPSSPVIALPNSGAVSLSNLQGSDLATFAHPSGWQLSALNATVFCSKPPASVGTLQTQGSGILFNITFREQGGREFNRSAQGGAGTNATLEIIFTDGSRMLFKNVLSSSQNATTFNYTKSPGAYLILPFDSNHSAAAGGVQDFSVYGNNFTLGGGSASSAPAWSLTCQSGGCYLFDGSDDFINGTLENLTEGAQAAGSSNWGFESTYNVSG